MNHVLFLKPNFKLWLTRTIDEPLACEGHGPEQKQMQRAPRRRPVPPIYHLYHHYYTTMILPVQPAMVMHFYLCNLWTTMSLTHLLSTENLQNNVFFSIQKFQQRELYVINVNRNPEFPEFPEDLVKATNYEGGSWNFWASRQDTTGHVKETCSYTFFPFPIFTITRLFIVWNSIFWNCTVTTHSPPAGGVDSLWVHRLPVMAVM